jgi:hypothetical protein
MTWRTVTMAEYVRRISGTPQDGPSPGGAAADLNMSRQAVYQALNRGMLDAYQITKDGSHVATVITQASIEAYRRNPRRRA